MGNAGSSQDAHEPQQIPESSRMPYNFNNFENVLQAINSRYISLPEHEVRRNNEILTDILKKMITEMKSDSLFAQLYMTIFFGGSFFDGLKVGKPEEFDLDILLKIPRLGKPVIQTTNEPGYLWVKFEAPQELGEDFRRKFLDERNYLSTANLKNWMIGLVTRASNKFRDGNGQLSFRVQSGGRSYNLRGRITTSGPAVTLRVNCSEFNMDVDLVPCFEFTAANWPTGGYRANPVTRRSTFFIVPKSPLNQNPPQRYWRLSFQEQERELLSGKETLKPTLKLLKKLRDTQGHVAIASYYIKTIFLWEDEKNGGASYWRGTLTEIFFKMLDNYIRYIESGQIPYFWNKKNNLLKISEQQRDNIKNRLRAIQKDLLAKYQTDPLVICRYIGVQLA